MIYTNSDDRRIYLDVPVSPTAGTLTVTVFKDGVQVFEVGTVVVDTDGRLYFVLPFSLTQTDSIYQVHWVFNYTEDTQVYEYDNWTTEEVVTAILPIREIRSILGPDATDEEVYAIERAVRTIIQSHTGQFFGRYVGKFSITGSGEPTLRLPRRLIQMTSINGYTTWQDTLSIRGNGWFLKQRSYGPPSIRADIDGWHENPWTSPAPISAPYSRVLHTFVEDAEYVIDGVWGWNTIPEKVTEAARLLVNDYACGDAMYRDRFLKSISSADWQISFHDGAFSNTGNVRANQLLSEFVLRRGWTVI